MQLPSSERTCCTLRSQPNHPAHSGDTSRGTLPGFLETRFAGTNTRWRPCHASNMRLRIIQLTILWALALAAAAAFLPCGSAAAAAPSCPVASVSDLVQALGNAQCSLLRIESGALTLTQAAWTAAMEALSARPAGAPAADPQPPIIKVSRNVTLAGGSGTQAAVLDCGYLKSRISLSPNAVFRIEDLTLSKCRQPSGAMDTGAGLDLLALSAGSQLVLANVSCELALCAPLPDMVRRAAAVPRPAGVPGQQQAVRLVLQGASSCLTEGGTGAGTASGSESKSGPVADCSDGAVHYDDFAQNATAPGPGGLVSPSGGVVRYLDVTALCMHVISTACVAAQGLAECTQRAVASLDLGTWDSYDMAVAVPEAGVVGGPSDAETLRLLAVVLPTVMLGLGLLFTLVGVVVWTRQRRKFTPCPKGIKEAYEGVVFVGLSGGSEENPPPPPLEGDLAAAVLAGQSKGAKHTAGSGEEVISDEVWSGDGHRYPPSWDGQDCRGRGSASLTVSNCTSTSAPAIVGIIVAGAPTAPATTAPASTSSRGDFCASTAAHYHLHDTYPSHNHNNHHNLHYHHQNHMLLESLGAGSGDAPSSPRAAVNLVLGVDVIVTAQPVLGRSPLGSAMLGQYGQLPVAVRMFHRDALDGSREELRALKQDLEGLARHGYHPNVVAVVGTGEAPGGDEVFVLEELVTTNLRRVCQEGPGLPMERALSIALDVALGLSYLHPNIVHRDLKPESVLLDTSYNGKVADYGLGRLLDFGPEAMDVEIARARYLAPECFNVKDSRSASGVKSPSLPQSDIFSLGVLLWEMLSRETPWRGMDAAQIALAVACQNRRLDIPINDRFPPKVRKLIQQCWEQEPRKRPAAAEVAKRLSHVIHQHRGRR